MFYLTYIEADHESPYLKYTKLFSTIEAATEYLKKAYVEVSANYGPSANIGYLIFEMEVDKEYDSKHTFFLNGNNMDLKILI